MKKIDFERISKIQWALHKAIQKNGETLMSLNIKFLLDCVRTLHDQVQTLLVERGKRSKK